MENVIAAAQAIYTDEQRMLLENFRKMAESEFAPLAEKYEELGYPPNAETLKGLFAKVEEFGLISGLIPEADGGAVIDRMTYGILYEELARIWADLAIAVLIQGHAVFAINLLGDKAQKEAYLKPLLRSERICATCISEPSVGSTVREVKTRAACMPVRPSGTASPPGHERGGTRCVCVCVCAPHSPAQAVGCGCSL